MIYQGLSVGIAHLHNMQMIANYIRSFEDITSLQDGLDKISDCCKKNKMKVNVKKCKIMRITRKKSPLVRDSGAPNEDVVQNH